MRDSAEIEIGVAQRESDVVVGISADGSEEVLQGIEGGPGHHSDDPEPGSDGWTAAVQGEINLAALIHDEQLRAYEVNIWKMVAEEMRPLSDVSRTTGNQLMLKTRTGARKTMTAQIVSPAVPLEERRAHSVVDVPLRLPDALINLVGRHLGTVVIAAVAKPITTNKVKVYSRQMWAEKVEDLLEELADRLMPDEDGVLFGQVDSLTEVALQLLTAGDKEE